MGEVTVRDTQIENVAFFHRVWDQAITRRLSFIQREVNNYSLLECELPNVWQTVQKCYQRKDWQSVVAFQDALRLFLERRGHVSQSFSLNMWACEAAKSLGDTVTATRFTHDQADLLQRQRNYSEAERLYQQCEEGYRALGENEMALKSRHMCSLAVRAQGRFRTARRLCLSVLDEARRGGLDQWLAHPFYILALLARDQKKFQEAELLIEESLSRLKDTEDLAMIAQCHRFRGSVALLRGDFVKARTELEKSLSLCGLHGTVATERLLGNLARAEGQYDEAKTSYEKALGIASQLNDLYEVARLLTEQAKLMTQVGKRDTAILLLRGSLSTFQEIDNTKAMADVFALLVWLYLRQGRWGQALRTVQAAFVTLLTGARINLGRLCRLNKTRNKV
jgi:tetratricopeptide (TPR) repeat protein